MKKTIVFLKIAVVIVIVGGSLAFTKAKFFGQGEVYCASNCTIRLDYKPSSNGTITDPCENGGNVWGINWFAGGVCEQYPSGTKYISTPNGK